MDFGKIKTYNPSIWSTAEEILNSFSDKISEIPWLQRWLQRGRNAAEREGENVGFQILSGPDLALPVCTMGHLRNWEKELQN